MSQSVRDILCQIGYTNLSDNGEYYRTKPLYRNSTNDTSLSIHKETGYWYDFGSGQKGSIKDLAKITSGQNISFKISYSKKDTIDEKHLSQSDKQIYKYLTKDYTYWKKRGANEEHLRKLKSGVFNHDGKFRKRYVFPIYDCNGFIVGYSGRTLHDKTTIDTYKIPKWKHIGNVAKWDYPYYFNKKRIKAADRVILVESIGDMLSLFSCEIFNVMVCFGLNVQHGVLKVLLSKGWEKIIIAFNNDDRYNGLIAAAKAKDKLHDYFDEEVIEICLPKNKNDFGEMTKREIKYWHKQILNF